MEKIAPLSGDDGELRSLAAALRGLSLPIIGRLSSGRLLLDCRCLENEGDFLAQWAALPEALT